MRARINIEMAVGRIRNFRKESRFVSPHPSESIKPLVDLCRDSVRSGFDSLIVTAFHRRISMTRIRCALLLGTLCFLSTAFSCSSSHEHVGDDWRERNSAVVKAHGLKGRDRAVPETDVVLALEPGKTYELETLPVIDIAPGVSATVAWGSGALLEVVDMKSGASSPEESLKGELITVIREGSATLTVDGRALQLQKDDVVYLTPGMKRTLRAGAEGATAIEVYSPVRKDHLALAGVTLPANADVSFPDQGVTPSLKPAEIVNLNEVQWTALTPPDMTKTYRRSGAHSRLVWGRNAMLSFVRMDAGSRFPMHIHPEDQLMMTLRGKLVEGVMDGSHEMTGAKHHVLLQPGNMAHDAHLSEFGADALDVFWPVRPDYLSKHARQTALYREVVDEGVRPVKVAEGFTFSEGPTWLDGSLFFSDMYFRDHRNGDWTGDVKQSRTIRLAEDGRWSVFAQGMQTNGTIASTNGNLLVCDMFGHRVVEMDPRSGRVVRTALDRVDGKPIDGPNDLVMDAKGGIYVSDPQFTPEEKKSQPGKQVYYVAPDGSAKVVIPAGEYAMPNGVEISPDGKTFYVDNTWFQPGGNFVWAYDIQKDGTLIGKRKFARLHLTPEVLSAEKPENRYDSRADGMTVDADGRVYIATLSGVQIFDKDGTYVGTIWCPQYPASCTFGGENYDVLYMVGESSVWSIQTKVKGFRYPDGLE